MWKQAHTTYLESRILAADPMELVRLMYQSAIGEVRNARQHLEKQDISGRAGAIGKACALLAELNQALDRKAGGDYAERLADLYGYMMNRLSEANFQQREEPLTEVLGLLTTLLEGWEGAQKQLEGATAGEEAPAEAKPQTAFTGALWNQREDSGSASRAWSF